MGLMNTCFSASLAQCIGSLSSPLLEKQTRELKTKAFQQNQVIQENFYIIPAANVRFNFRLFSLLTHNVV